MRHTQARATAQARAAAANQKDRQEDDVCTVGRAAFQALAVAVAEAKDHASRAYEFTPNSYTYAAFTASVRVAAFFGGDQP
jgi:hypothetical protein